MTTTLFGYVDPVSDLQTQIHSMNNGNIPILNKGDLLTKSTHITNLAVGINNQLLMANSTTATGLIWSSDVTLNNLNTNELHVTGLIENVSADRVVVTDNTGTLTYMDIDDIGGGSGGSGDVVGPSSATDNTICRFDDTTGKLIQNSGVIINDANDISGVNSLTLSSSPSLDNTQTQILVRNSTTGLINRRDNIVDTTSSQTLTNKTLTSPVILTISNTGTLTLPTSTDTLVGRDTTDTLTNKTINSTTNTIQVSGTDINSLINQDVRSSASPSFSSLSANSLSLSSGTTFSIINSPTFNINSTTGQTSVYSLAAGSFTLPSIGVDNTQNNIAAVNVGGSFCIRTNIVDTDDVQTLTNKTINGLTSNGITLTNAISGYTPTSLDYYEYYSTNSLAIDGPYAIYYTPYHKYVRIGKMVTLSIESLLQIPDHASSDLVITQYSTDYIPARFRPLYQVNHPIRIVDTNGSITAGNGLFRINTDGTYVISSDFNDETAVFHHGFSGTAGFLAINVSYVCA